jgi:hypothetical protein
MRARILLPCVVLIAVCLWFLLRPAAEQHIATVSHETTPTTDKRLSQPAQAQTAERSHASAVDSPSATNSATDSNRAFRQKLTEQMTEQWRAPVEFYGRVVDENANPVAGASIEFSCNDLSASGTSYYHTKSDTNGLFSIGGIQGKILGVKASKEGYYSYLPFGDNFLYAGGSETFVPHPNDPVVFHLRKKGQGVELITSDNGIRLKVDVRLPRDNTPVRVDFLQKQSGPAGQLEISQNKPPWHDATGWSFRMSIPDGGFVENEDTFQFEAPETNYKSTVEYRFTKSETNWTTQVSKQFYIVFGQPRKYGWLRIESNLAQETVFLTYAINPSGSRNLEPIN